MTRKKLGRMRTSLPDEHTAQKYLLWISGWNIHHEPEKLPSIESSSLFSNNRPLELEAGCGSGEFLCYLAVESPERNFVGVDLHAKSLYRAVENASGLELDNILFVRADFRQIYPLLAPDSLSTVYLHFPEPPTNRISRRRVIFSEHFLEEMHRALVPEGRLGVVTDHEEHLFEMLEMAESDERWEKTHEKRYLTGFERGVKSRFQQLWEDRGRLPLRFELTKRDGPELAHSVAEG